MEILTFLLPLSDVGPDLEVEATGVEIEVLHDLLGLFEEELGAGFTGFS